jgi:amino acid transporter
MTRRRRVVVTIVVAFVLTVLLLWSGIFSGLPSTRGCHTTVARPSGNFLAGSSTVCVLRGWPGWLEWTAFMIAIAGIVFAFVWVCLKPRSQWPRREKLNARNTN